MDRHDPSKKNCSNIPIKNLDIPLERDIFSRSIIRELTGLLEEMIGLEEASGYISVVGQRIATEIDSQYKNVLKVDRLNKQQISDVLIDLKTRIKGGFHVIEANENKIVMGNSVCPFGDKSKNRPSLCMMTSNVFGTIAADNAGYAKVVLDKTIARGDPSCLVTVYFNETEEAKVDDGKEYYRAGA